jgi:YHS domain-containing protein
MIRLIYYALIFYLLYRLIKGFLKQGKEYQKKAEDERIDEMVQDPFCKIYIPRREAFSRNLGGKEILFCSKECADKFEFNKKINDHVFQGE